MAEKNFKVGESIEVQYQAGNGESGLTINMWVVKPDKTYVSPTPTALTEIGNSGRYYGQYVPNSEGDWSVQIERADGTGKVTKSFSVGAYHLEELGATVQLAVGKLDDQNTNLGVVKTNTDKLPQIETDMALVKTLLQSLPMIA